MLVRLSSGGVRALIYVSGLASPKTRWALGRVLPTRAKARVEGGLLFIELDLSVAPEGHRLTLCSGDVAYWPPASALLVTLWEGCKPLASPVNYLGRVVSGLEQIRSLRGAFEVELSPTDGEDV